MEYVTHHPKYFMVGGDLHILIDDVMFKVHSYFFRRESRNFFDGAEPPSSPSPEPGSPEIGDSCTSESRAIRIPDVTVEEFERFLWVFYNPKYSIYSANIYSWFSILKLAHRWDFPEVKDFALRELKRRESEIPLVTRIRLYQEYEAPLELLVPLFSELCSRESSPTNEEIVELGFEQACYVWKAREALRFPDGVTPLPGGVTQKDVYAVVADIMGLPEYFDEGTEQTEVTEVQPGPGVPVEGEDTAVVQDTKTKKKKRTRT
ncbi:hypothetical protein FA13DRAFT_1690465 [Coprinellus micaceus]|uniref:BTB domain-containing protein n=1 Tax=Coprinellus micaceus TaxID=71717 RepID=A0A4Y7T3N9_COPMI|nr:hypothetical protein FA13DRAFT_1690465 [Coprinellus micaceus]